MSKIAFSPNANGNGVFTISSPNSGTNRAIALPDAAGTIPLLAAASNTAITSTPAELNILDGVTSTAAELNILDGVTATAAELNLIDGGTARGTTAVADGDGILINDAGTMRMSTVQTVKTYMTDGVGASTTYDAVGTYAFLYSSSTGMANGSTYAGSSLYPAGLLTDANSLSADDDISSGIAYTRGGVAVTGTWRAMGRSMKNSGTSKNRFTLFVRIS